MNKIISSFAKRTTSYIVAFSILLTTVCSVISMNGISASAGPSIWDGNIATSFAGGTGKVDDPYQIENGGQLYKALNECGKDAGGSPAYYKITADIYLNENYEAYKTWGTTKPANSWPYLAAGKEFAGYLDGGYHTVYGLYLTSPKDNYRGGLICRLQGTSTFEATVCNLIVSNAYVAPHGAAGAVVGQMQGNAAVSNCIARNVTATGYGSIGAVVGAMSGKTNTISNCAAYDIKLTDTFADRDPGGIVGFANTETGGKMSNSFSAGYYPVGVKNPHASLVVTNCSTDNGKGARNGDGATTYSQLTNITKRDNSKMQGADAVANMGLSKEIWLNTATYPTLNSAYSDVKFAGGEGTADEPYLIKTAVQLEKAITDCGKSRNGSPSYYKIVKDIVINEGYEDYDDWGKNPPAKAWPYLAEGSEFAGHLDGGFHTIYGLYVKDEGGYRGGLICRLKGNSSFAATVCNLIVSNAYVAPKGTAGAVVGCVEGVSNVTNCIVKDSIITGDSNIGGVVGSAMDSNTKSIENCAAYDVTVKDSNADTRPGGILGRNIGSGAVLSNCFSAGYYPLGAKQAGIVAVNCSTDIDECYDSINKKNTTISGVTTIKNSKMQGADAVANMGLSEDAWQATDAYPTLYVNVWDGKTAESFAGGDGTKDDPYLIKNGGQLCKAVTELGKSSGTNSYYKIIADIYLNRDYENYADWGTTKPANSWPYIASDKYFIGYLDGGYHTVYGLYLTSPEGKYGGGLICRLQGTNTNTTNNTRDWTATVCNLTVSNAYVAPHGTAGAVVGQMQGKSAVTNCVAKNVIATGYGSVGAVVGGMVKSNGTNDPGNTINNCAAYNIKLTDTYSKRDPGGIIGYANAAKSKLTNCFSAGYYPVGVKQVLATVTNCSTDNDKGARNGEGSSSYTKLTGITKRDNSKMQGSSAVSNMNLSGDVWKNTDTYPTLVGYIEKKGDIWTGTMASGYADGTGKITDPFIIETAAQLYRAVKNLGKSTSGSALYYKLAADIILNKDYENYADWGTAAPQNNWLPIDNSSDSFIGHIDGDGHTIYGLYASKSYHNNAGLIAKLKGGSVRDLYIKNSYIKGTQNEIGSVVGFVDGSAKIIRCIVTDTAIEATADKNVGGIAGGSQSGSIIGCASYDLTFVNSGAQDIYGGILGRAKGSTNILESYSSGAYPIQAIGSITASKVYTDKGDVLTKSGVVGLTTAEMQGSKAFDKMLLNVALWETDENGFPVLRDYVEGTKDTVWSGGIAKNYAGGSGTKSAPFIIETGEQLYKMIFENCLPNDVKQYYKLNADIKLNNTEGELWYENTGLNMWPVYKNFTYSTADNIDGAGHTVSGIYTTSESGPAYTGLIPIVDRSARIENIGVINSYITVANKDSNFAGGVVGYIDDWDSVYTINDANIPVIRGCFAGESVTVGGKNSGGIVGGVSGATLIENCYFVGKFKSNNGYAIIGNIWTDGTIIRNSYAATVAMHSYTSGGAIRRNGVTYESCYNFGNCIGNGLSFVGINNMRGENAKTSMPGLDYDNVWVTVDGGTPVLRVFGANAEKYTSVQDAYSTIEFITNDPQSSLAPMRGKVGTAVTLPTPERDGYRFAGWYVYSELQCEYTYGIYPYLDIVLHAKWEPLGIAQDFEDYPDTSWDLDPDYVYFRIGAPNYDANYVYSGMKSLMRKGESSEREDFLVKYEEELTVGKKYTISFWMNTETEGATGKVSMLHATWPDINEPVKGDEVTIAKYSDLSVGKWKQYKYTFTAKTPWIVLRTDGDTILYFDDILIYPSK